MDLNQTIERNLQSVNDAIAAACDRASRRQAEVKLVAVTKYAELSWVEALTTLHPVFGENRPQQLAERQPMFPTAEWHLIGQLQRNKVRMAVENASWIHSVDSQRLLERIAFVARELKRRPRILLQVNVSGEASKSGFSPSELIDSWRQITALQPDVDIAGLMTMAPASENPENARPTFHGLAELRHQLADRAETVDAGVPLGELSMGMSGDFEVAVEEGATLVRIGSRLYSGLTA